MGAWVSWVWLALQQHVPPGYCMASIVPSAMATDSAGLSAGLCGGLGAVPGNSS